MNDGFPKSEAPTASFAEWLRLDPDGWHPTPDTLAFWGQSVSADGGVDIKIPRQHTEPEAAAHPIAAPAASLAEAEIASRVLGRPLVELSSCKDIINLQGDLSVKSLTLVCLHQEISYELLDRIVLQQDPRAGRAAIGFVTGRHRAALRWMLAKTLLLASGKQPGIDGHLSMFACPSVGDARLYENDEVLWWQDLTTSAAQRAADRTYRTATLLSHANGVDGNFNNIVLCPVRNIPVSPHRGPQPSCLYSDLCQRDPGGRLYRLHPDAVRAPIILYDTCAGFLAEGGIARAEASLGTAFLEAYAGAYITTIRKKMSDPFAALLFRRLLEGGYRLGEIVAFLNRYQKSEYGEFPSFVVFGDPVFAYGGPTLEHPEENMLGANKGTIVVTTPLSADADNILIATSQDVQAALTIDLRRGFGEQDENVLILTHSHSSAELHAFPLGYSLSRADHLSGRIEDARDILQEVCRGLKSVAPSADVSGMSTAAARAESLKQTIDDLRRASRSCAWSVQSAEALVNNLKACETEVTQLGAALCVGWIAARQWLVLHHFYGHWLDQIHPERRLATPCPACGLRGVGEKRFVRFGREGLRRHMWTCVRCGVVGDMPSVIESVALNGPSDLSAGHSGKFTLEVALDCDDAQFTGDVVAQPYFGGFGSAVIDATLPGSPLAAGPDAAGTVSIPFEVSVAERCVPGLYSLVVIGAYLGQPFLCARYLSVETTSTRQHSTKE